LLSAGKSSTSGTSSFDRAPLWHAVAFAVVLFVARFLASNLGELTEGDEILIAEGVATISNGSIGPIYRYGPQFGYYRLVELLASLTGGVLRIPVIMVLLSVVAGTLIPVLGLFAFRADLDRRERWLLALALAVNPIIWASSAYGNTAMPAVALAGSALVLLSNRPSQRTEIVALALFAAAIFVRADVVLVTGALGVLLWRNHGAFRPAAMRVAALGVVVATVYGVLFAVDAQMQGLAAAVASHRTNVFPTLFWDYLLWAVSPFPLIFAIIGFRELEPRRRWLLAILAAWCLPVIGFYFGNTTTPRYHLLNVLPLSVAGVVGLVAVVRMVPRFRRIAAVVCGALFFAHAFVAVGRFTPGQQRSWLNEGSIPSHDGSFSTGALLYKAYRLRTPDVGQLLSFRYELRGSQQQWVRTLETGQFAGRHVVVIADGVYSPFLHWSAEVSGFQMDSWNRTPDLDCAEFKFRVSGAQVTTSDRPRIRDHEQCRLGAAAGDEIWLVRPTAPEVLALILARLPAGLRLDPIEVGDASMARYRLESAS
jgi:hypothetical protein